MRAATWWEAVVGVVIVFVVGPLAGFGILMLIRRAEVRAARRERQQRGRA